MERDQVIDQIVQAFARTAYPGDEYLQGSVEGCEPFEVVGSFKGQRDWRVVEPAVLDANAEALSFFSEGGLRFFLPAYLIADLRDQLERADPVFHLTHGFYERTLRLPSPEGRREKNLGGSAFVNPRRYGAMTAGDYARFRLSVFVREEARAILGYLQCIRGRDTLELEREAIDAALDTFWRHRAEHAPTHDDLARHVQSEQAFLEGSHTDSD